MLITHWTQYTPGFGNADYSLVVNHQAGSNVPVTVQVNESYAPGAGGFGINWVMELQRYDNPDGTFQWITIGTRTGYAHADSWSHRTFEGVAKRNRAMRVVLHSSTTENYRRIVSKQWMR